MTIQRTWKQLTSIQVGGALCLPVMMTGHTLTTTYGLVPALIALVVGNGVLCVLALGAFYMTWRSKRSTMQQAHAYFGPWGTYLLTAIMALCLMGWFTLQLTVMSTSIYQLGASLGNYPLVGMTSITLILGTCITALASRGIKALDILARISAVLLGSSLIYILTTLPIQQGHMAQAGYAGFSGVSLVLATAIALLVDIPTYYRFAKTAHDGIISMVLFFLIALPLIELVGVYCAWAIRGQTLITTLYRNGSTAWHVWISFCLVLAGWATNTMNLYSSSINIDILMPRASYALRTYILGGVATGVACFSALDHFQFTLEAMGVALASMAAVMLISFLTSYTAYVSRTAQIAFICSWLVGTVAGFCSLTGSISLTGMPVLDSWVVAALSTVLCSTILVYIERITCKTT